MTKDSAQFFEPRNSWVTNDPASKRTHYMGMTGRISVASLLAHMATIAPEVRPEEMMLNWATVTWRSEPTAEDVAERVAQRAKNDERREAWERKTLGELLEKYGDPR